MMSLKKIDKYCLHHSIFYIFMMMVAILSTFPKNHSPFARVIWIGAGTKNPKIILDKNEFTINTKQGMRTRWRCTQYFKSKCRASLVTYGRIVKVSQFHNHQPTNPASDKLLPQRVTIVRNKKIVFK